MINFGSKFLIGACALGLWGMAEAQPISWQLGANIGDRSWDSPGYLKNNIDFHVASFSVSAGYQNLFASFLVEKSISNEPIELAFDSSGLDRFPSFNFPSSGSGSANRSEYSFVGGYNFPYGFSGFLGYVSTQVDISNLTQVLYTFVDEQMATLLYVDDAKAKLSTHGPFVGAGYRYPVGEIGALSFSIAYAHLAAKGEVKSDNPSNYCTSMNGCNAIYYDTPAHSGNASGFSYGASWFGKFPGTEDWLRTMRYVVSAKLYKYNYLDASFVSSQTNANSKETYTVFTLGLTKTF